MKSSQGQKKNVQQVKNYFQTIKQKPALEIKFLIKNFLSINDPQQFKKILDNSELRKIPEWERFRTRFRAKQLDYLIDKMKLYIDQVKTNLKEGGSQKKYKAKLDRISKRQNPIIQINQDTRSRQRQTDLKQKLKKEQNFQTLKNLLQNNSLIPQNNEQKNTIIPWNNIFYSLDSFKDKETFFDLLFKKRNFDFRYRVDIEEFKYVISEIYRLPRINNSFELNFMIVFTCMSKFFINKKIDWQNYCNETTLNSIKQRLKDNLERYDKNTYSFKNDFYNFIPNPDEKIKISRDFLNQKQATQKQKYKTYLNHLKNSYEPM